MGDRKPRLVTEVQMVIPVTTTEGGDATVSFAELLDSMAQATEYAEKHNLPVQLVGEDPEGNKAQIQLIRPLLMTSMKARLAELESEGESKPEVETLSAEEPPPVEKLEPAPKAEKKKRARKKADPTPKADKLPKEPEKLTPAPGLETKSIASDDELEALNLDK